MSTAIDDVTLTHGRGELDDHGFWEIPCGPCARAGEARSPEHGERWPFAPKGVRPMHKPWDPTQSSA